MAFFYYRQNSNNWHEFRVRVRIELQNEIDLGTRYNVVLYGTDRYYYIFYIFLNFSHGSVCFRYTDKCEINPSLVFYLP